MQIKSIFDGLLVQPTGNQTRRLWRIDSENFSDVIWKVLAEKAGARATFLDEGVYALKQYYAVALLDPKNAHAVSLPVDPFWHHHVLFSEKYVPFCDEVVGQYMHHRPLNHQIQPHVEATRRLYDYTLDVLSQLFEQVSPTFWPIARSDADVICTHYRIRNTEVLREAHFSPSPRGVPYELVV